MNSIHKAMVVLSVAAVLATGLAVADTATQKKSTTKATSSKTGAVAKGATTKSASTAKTGTASKKKSYSSKKGSTATKTPAAGASKTSASHTAASHAAGTTKRRTTAASAKPSPAWRSRQLQPTPDRYKEIQQALVSKGYLKSEPTGAWNQESVDALRRFQQDQSLEASGKIDSLSLIALGLGPKRETASAKPAAPPATTN